jgi:hypothetical protein
MGASGAESNRAQTRGVTKENPRLLARARANIRGGAVRALEGSERIVLLLKPEEVGGPEGFIAPGRLVLDDGREAVGAELLHRSLCVLELGRDAPGAVLLPEAVELGDRLSALIGGHIRAEEGRVCVHVSVAKHARGDGGEVPVAADERVDGRYRNQLVDHIELRALLVEAVFQADLHALSPLQTCQLGEVDLLARQKEGALHWHELALCVGGGR